MVYLLITLLIKTKHCMFTLSLKKKHPLTNRGFFDKNLTKLEWRHCLINDLVNSNEFFDILPKWSIRINFYICYLYFKELAFRLKLASVTSASGASPSILCLAADNQVDYDGWIHSIAHISQNTNTEKVILQLKYRYIQ